ncbi:unnamed protein product, partial [Lampetra fluviatilis]
DTLGSPSRLWLETGSGSNCASLPPAPLTPPPPPHPPPPRRRPPRRAGGGPGRARGGCPRPRGGRRRHRLRAAQEPRADGVQAHTRDRLGHDRREQLEPPVPLPEEARGQVEGP